MQKEWGSALVASQLLPAAVSKIIEVQEYESFLRILEAWPVATQIYGSLWQYIKCGHLSAEDAIDLIQLF